MDTGKQVHIDFFFLASCPDATQPKGISKGSARGQVSGLSEDAIARRHQWINASDRELTMIEVSEERVGGDEKLKK